MWKLIGAVLSGMMFLCGCESVQLEERSFPLAAGIDLQQEEESLEGEERKLVVSFDFPDLAQISEKGKTTDTPMGMSLEGVDMYHVEKSYENNTNRLLDYNHLKAVVLGEDLIKNQKSLRRFLLAWEQQESSARNVNLFLGSSAAEILSLTEETEGSMGKYLEEMLESQKDFRQNKTATLGSLMNQWHNQDELLLIPMLTEQGNRPTVTAYGAVLNFQYRGTLSVKEAMEIFLCQNLLKKFTCELSEYQVAEISELQVLARVEENEDVPVITISINGKGRMITGEPSSSVQQYRLEEKIEKRFTADLQETAKKLRTEYAIDMANTYSSLGGLNRKLYRKYLGQPEVYNQKAQQVFEVDINLLNWK